MKWYLNVDLIDGLPYENAPHLKEIDVLFPIKMNRRWNRHKKMLTSNLCRYPGRKPPLHLSPKSNGIWWFVLYSIYTAIDEAITFDFKENARSEYLYRLKPRFIFDTRMLFLYGFVVYGAGIALTISISFHGYIFFYLLSVCIHATSQRHC